MKRRLSVQSSTRQKNLRLVKMKTKKSKRNWKKRTKMKMKMMRAWKSLNSKM